MKNRIKCFVFGDVEDGFFVNHKKQLAMRNIKMLKTAYSFAIFINVGLLIYAYVDGFIKELRVFYLIFSLWFIIWGILVYVLLDKYPKYTKLFYAILAGTALTITAIAGTYYSPNMCAVTYMVFLIFIPGLYVDRPYLCFTSIIPSGIIFILLVFYFKSDPFIITIDIVNTVFSRVVSIFYSLYSINLQLENIQASIILHKQSSTDELTHLPNRRSFNKKIDHYFTNEDIEDISQTVDKQG